MQNKIYLHLAIFAFGVQFATTLQMANTSSLFKFLGASSAELPYLWLAAPITGLLIQPLIGQLSDNTSTLYGKRKPYLLFGGLFTAFTVLLMPFMTVLALEALLLWILDSSLNCCNETLRALTTDLTNDIHEKTRAFSLQTAFAGAGSALAAFSPQIIYYFFPHFSKVQDLHIPHSIQLAFVTGSVIMLICLVWLLFFAREKIFRKKTLLQLVKQHENHPWYYYVGAYFKKFYHSLRNLPPVIRMFFPIQMLTWMGMFSFFLYFNLAISQHFFGLPPGAVVNTHIKYVKLLAAGTRWSGVFFGIYQVVSVLYALVLPFIAKRVPILKIHGVSLVIGASGILALNFTHHLYYAALSMVAMGIMWGSIMTMPYSLIAGNISKLKAGAYLGIFNITITVPQIISGLFWGILIAKVFHSNALRTLSLGAIFILLAGILAISKRSISHE